MTNHQLEERICANDECDRRFKVMHSSPARYCCSMHDPKLAAEAKSRQWYNEHPKKIEHEE
jgi:hypothetical protein